MSHELSDDDGHYSRSEDEINNLDDGHELTTIDNKPKDNDENEDETGRRIDPETSKKRIIRKPIPKLNTARLRGPKGVHTIEKYFEGFKFHGKGHEKNDLNRVMKRLEHWSHRLFPKYQFDDFLEKVEALGAKRDLQPFLIKYRRDELSDDLIMMNADGDAITQREPSPEPVDAFDLLIAEQIEKTKQVTMPQTQKPNGYTPDNNSLSSTNEQISVSNNSNSNVANSEISNEEIKKRIERNRQLAIERRLAKLKRDEEIKNKNKTEETTEIINRNSQERNELKIDENISVIESEIISQKDIFNSTDKKITTTTIHDKINLSLNDQSELNEGITRPLFTDEEINKTINDAVKQFMNKKRKVD